MKQKKSRKNEKRGFVFSMDTAYAILIVLLSSAVIISMLSTSQTDTKETLHLSRIARDIQDVNQSMEGEIDISDVEEEYGNIKINDCEDEDVVATHEAVVYDGDGYTKTITTKVCYD